MRECDNIKIHINIDFILSVCHLIMLDTFFLRPSLHCKTSLHFTTLHPATLHYTYRHFTSSHLLFTTPLFGLTHLHFLSFYFTSQHQTQYSSHLQTYFQNNEPHHFTKNPLHFTFYLAFLYWVYTSCYKIYVTLPYIRVLYNFMYKMRSHLFFIYFRMIKFLPNKSYIMCIKCRPKYVVRYTKSLIHKTSTFRHRASCILGQAFRYSPENAFYIFNQQIYFII